MATGKPGPKIKSKRMSTAWSARTTSSTAVEVSQESKALAHSLLSFEQIQLRAYEIFLTRGGTHGHDLDDWLAAGREFKTNLTR